MLPQASEGLRGLNACCFDLLQLYTDSLRTCLQDAALCSTRGSFQRERQRKQP